MKRLLIFIIIAVLAASPRSIAQDASGKIAIIKTDDLRGITAKWNRFFTLNKKKRVKVSAGINYESLAENNNEYFNWLRQLNTSDSVEFWNHGWDHKRWTTDENNRISEFSGSGYIHQKQHFVAAQKSMELVLAFGAPYNSVDRT